MASGGLGKPDDKSRFFGSDAFSFLDAVGDARCGFNFAASGRCFTMFGMDAGHLVYFVRLALDRVRVFVTSAFSACQAGSEDFHLVGARGGGGLGILERLEVCNHLETRIIFNILGSGGLGFLGDNPWPSHQAVWLCKKRSA